MRVAGKQVAERIYDALAKELAGISGEAKVTVVSCNPSPVTEQYLELKRKRAEEVGIAFSLQTFPHTTTTEEIVQFLQNTTGPTVVQLPLPEQIDSDAALSAVPIAYDVDGLRWSSEESHPYLPPVPGAIQVIFAAYDISYRDKEVVVIGNGRLVGAPVAKFLEQQGCRVSVLSKENFSPHVVKEGDIVISGVGKPHIIQPDMVKEGVILIDAGTSSSAGSTYGDIDLKCYEKASLYTPVPGGVGPITVAVLLANVVKAASSVKM